MTEQTRKSRREQKGKPKAHKTRQIHKKQACMYISYTLTYLHRERRHFCLLAGNKSEGPWSWRDPLKRRRTGGNLKAAF